MILTKLATHTPTEPSLLATEVPESVSSLIMQLIEKSPEKRPADAARVAAALDKLQRDLHSLAEVDRANASEHGNDDARATIALSAHPTALPERPAVSPSTNQALAQSPPGNRIRTPLIALAFGFGFFLLASIYFMSIKTKSGTLEVEVSADVDLRTRDGKLLIYDEKGELKYTIALADKQSSVPPGKYMARIQGADGVELESSEFEMKKDGVTKVRVVAKGPDPSSTSVASGTMSVPTAEAGIAFPGKMLWREDFEQSNQTRYPVIARDNEIRRLIDGRYECQFTKDYTNPVAFVPIGPSLMDGAIHYRIRRINCDHFFNFRAVNDGKRARWLTLNIRSNKWTLVMQRQDKEGNDWKQLSPIVILEGGGFLEDIVDGKWLDVSVRWSPGDYAIWLNNRLATKGTLEAWPELQGVERQPSQICIRRTDTSTMQLQLDSIELYDQSLLPTGESRDRPPASTTSINPK